jgi:pimeloyl-ACP methyl ester carboxylesterase
MLRRFVDEVVGGPAVLLGHSMGGVLALRYAAEHADTVTRLALLSPPVPGTTAAPTGHCRPGAPSSGSPASRRSYAANSPG